MTHQRLTSADIIRLGRAHAAQDRWQAVAHFARDLYGPQARQVVVTRLTITAGDAIYQGPQVVVSDTNRRPLPFDETTAWWQAHGAPTSDGLRDDLLGESLFRPQRGAVQDYAETALGIEYLTVWQDAPPEVIVYDLAQPPRIPFTAVTEGAVPLSAADCAQAGSEYDHVRLWERRRAYAAMLYSPHAATMRIRTYWRYNDNSYDESPFIDVFDAAGVRLPYDLTLPWWSRWNFTTDEIQDYQRRHPPGEMIQDPEHNELNQDDRYVLIRAAISTALAILRRDLLGVQYREVWGQAEPEEETYDLTQPPPVRWPEIWGEPYE